MPTRLPGTNDDGAFLKSDTFANYDIVGFKILNGGAGVDADPVSLSNPLATIDAATAFLGVGQVPNIPISGNAARIPTTANVRAVTVKALESNTAAVYIGNAATVNTSNGFELGPGQSMTFFVTNSNLLYVFASAANQAVCWAAY